MKIHVALPILIVVVVACSRGEDRSVTGPSGTQVTQAASASHGPSFNTHLRGDQEVPPVATHATGQAILFVAKKSPQLSFKLLVAGIENVTAAHIQCGASGVNGPVVATLYGGPVVSPTGTLALGSVGDANLITQPDSPECPGGVSSFAALVDQMRSGNTYVNIHTLGHPGGEIRGQIS
ncbi:MAG: CHRD domain-containing protein [Candidatus Rokuibacteriota bacterium]